VGRWYITLIDFATTTSPAVAIDQPTRSVRSFFSKYESVNNPVISEFISSIPDSFSDAVNRLMQTYVHSSSSTTNEFLLNNRLKLQKFIGKFHSEADTMTTGVTNGITLLNDPTTKLFVSIHQPNLFAYSGVFKKIVLLQTLKNMIEKRGREKDHSKKIVNLFLIVDHDFIGEIWIRLAQLPSVKHSLGRLELRLPVSNSKKWQMICNMPIPGRTVLDYWRKQITSWIRKNSSSSLISSASNRSFILDNFEQFWQEVELSYSKAKSYSDFNSFLMSQIVNKIWGYDTLFVRLTDISPVFEDGFRYLISNFSQYSDVLRKSENMFLRHGIDTGVSSSSYIYAPVWLHCKCGSKASVKIHEMHKKDQITLEGTCISCKRNLQINLGNKHKLELLKDEEVLHQLSPRAIPILLLLSRELGITCYAGGTGGSMNYTVVGSLAFKKLSIDMPPLTLAWPSREIYYGFGQSEALEFAQLTKQSDVMPYLESLKQKNAEYGNKIKPLIEERSQRVKAGKSIQTLLSDLFNLKEEQRKIRRLIKIAYKVKNAVYMNPCFVDYAVNFGVANTEMQWRENLLNNTNNSLTAPILMATKIKPIQK
jgi:hypothetical protein